MSFSFIKFFGLSDKERQYTAIQEGASILSYNEIDKQITSQTQILSQNGISSGHRVAFIASTSISSIITFFAILTLDATPCLLSTRIPEENRFFFAKQARCSFFVIPESNTLQKIDNIAPLPSAILLFTSGSSGNPKLVQLTLSNFLESALGSIPFLDLPGKWLLSVPLFHVSGLSILFRCFTSKSSLLFTPTYEATHLSFVPTQLLRLLQEKNFPYPHLRCLLLGGAPIGDSLLQKALEKKLPIRTTYGLTETASQISMSHTEDSFLSTHLGKVLPNRELSISKDGEILVRGKTLFSGYDNGYSLERPLTPSGWFASGDLGSFTPDGNLIYKGRKDNMFISGGENIYPEEIEKALSSFPGLLHSTVIPSPDLEFGHRPVAFIHLEHELIHKDSLKEHLLSKVPKFCVPIDFHPIPISFLGNTKILRKELAKYYINNFLK